MPAARVHNDTLTFNTIAPASVWPALAGVSQNPSLVAQIIAWHNINLNQLLYAPSSLSSQLTKLATKPRTRGGRRNRRAPAAQQPKGRLPLGTTAPSAGASLHSHIRIVPRDDHRDTAENLTIAYEDGTPVFRSSSLQFPPDTDQEPRRNSALTEVSTSGTTFADMARRFNQEDLEGSERPTSGPIPLSGLIKLQSSRSRKGNKFWRPLQPSDLGPGGDNEAIQAHGSPSPTDSSEAPGRPRTWSPPSSKLTDSEGSPSDVPLSQHNLKARPIGYQRLSESTRLDPQENAAVLCQVNNTQCTVRNDYTEVIPEIRPGIVENYMRLFGKLPDMIRLHEQTGDFDGQVVFIGHPNRDVSAHEWSSASFQWIGIGLWSHTRNRIEGGLSCDESTDANISSNSIENFKILAENRERHTKEFGRKKEDNRRTDIRSLLTEANKPASVSSISDLDNDAFNTFTPTKRASKASETHRSAHYASQTITREHLEDPFVTPTKPPQPVIPTSFSFRGSGANTLGSMDFGYEFPLKLESPMGHDKAILHPSSVYIQQERETIGRSEPPRESETPIYLPEVDFGEEASSAFSNLSTRVRFSRLQSLLSPEDVHRRRQLKKKLTELGDQTRESSITTEQRVAIPNMPILNTNIRVLFPPGPTVANPYRRVSTLNANAAPYTRMQTNIQVSEGSESDLTAINAPPATNLYFSDPDGIRQSYVPEITNGVSQQVPTRQNFNGPFFSESMPTAHDPTASFTLQTNNNEELIKWFLDGPNPARQQDYAKSLIAMALATNKTRKFGAIGEEYFNIQDRTKYEYTPFFVRVYENLFKYAEESRAGGSLSYFTRAWKPAAPSLRDLTLEGNNSFFGRISSASPQIYRGINWQISPFHGRFVRSGRTANDYRQVQTQEHYG